VRVGYARIKSNVDTDFFVRVLTGCAAPQRKYGVVENKSCCELPGNDYELLK
jgi:hypothetical protein